MTRKRQARISFMLELAITNAVISQVFDQELTREGIRPVQAGVLTLISLHAPVTPSVLERRSGLPGGTLRDRIRTLVKEGLVRTVPNDADQRSHFIELTRDGEAIVAKVAPIVKRVESMLSAELGRDVNDLQASLSELQDVARRLLVTEVRASPNTRTKGPW